MKKSLKWWISILSVVGIAALGVGATSAKTQKSADQPFQVIKLVEPIFPQELIDREISEGKVRIVFSVNEKGKLSDALVVEATDPAFEKAAMAALQKSTFSPEVVSGTPQAVVKEVTYDFKKGVPFTLSVWDAEYRNVSEVDEPPVVLKSRPHPFLPKEKSGTAKITIEFWVDEKGKVRFPRVKESNKAEWNDAVVKAVAQWEFKPAFHNGKPVVVRFEQKFNFSVERKSK